MIQTYSLDRGGAPLYEQLYRALKADILSGVLPGGGKLPSGRALSEHLGVSRVTVETAYAQLLAEGYVPSRERAGYFVEAVLPRRLCRSRRLRRRTRRSRLRRRRRPRGSFRFPSGRG